MNTKKHLNIITLVIACFCSAATAFAADHVAQIDITVSQGKVGSHFSKYHGRQTITIPVSKNGDTIKLPWGRSDFTKLAMRDDSSPEGQRRITPASPWKQEVKFSGAGIYILDISDWDDSPSISVTLTIDGVVRFKGSGNASKIVQWSNNVFGPGIRITDDRELAVDLKE